MSWYSTAWKNRFPVSVDNVSGSGTVDVTFTIPPTLSLFWDSVRSDGFDVVVTDSDGHTLLTYERETWTYATQTAVFELHASSPNNADCVAVCWVYYANAAATDGSGSFAVSSAKTGTVELAAPGVGRVAARREAPGARKPAQVITKGSVEAINVWVDVTGLLTSRTTAFDGSSPLDEVASIQVNVTDGGVSQTGMFEAGVSSIIEAESGFCWVKVRVKAGSSGTDYTLQVKIITTGGETYTPRFLLRVRDVDES